MKESGCYYFAYGVESANPQILKNIKKRESIETIERAIEIADKAGISAQGFFIFGLPGETASTIEENINFARQVKIVTRAIHDFGCFARFRIVGHTERQIYSELGERKLSGAGVDT